MGHPPRKIFAHLLTFRPSPEELAWWMCHEEEIDRRVKGTEYAAMIDKQAPSLPKQAQAGAVIAEQLFAVLDAEAEEESE